MSILRLVRNFTLLAVLALAAHDLAAAAASRDRDHLTCFGPCVCGSSTVCKGDERCVCYHTLRGCIWVRVSC